MEPSLKKRRTQWNVPSSECAKNTFNPIRNIVDGLKIVPNPEKEMIALSIGDPTVFGNLPPAESVNNAVIEICKEGKSNGYAASVGSAKARAAVAKYTATPESPLELTDVVFASGCSGALDMAITVLANPGQHVLIPRPGFSLYKTLCHATGIKTKEYNCLPEKCWEIDLKHLESLIDDQTACIVVNNPSNPCGSVFSVEHIQDILAIAERNKVPIIADEIYAHFTYHDKKYVSMASQTSTVPILACGGLAKRFLVPGWRIGWICIHDRNGIFEKEVRKGLLCLSQRILGPNSLIMGAIEQILFDTPQEFYDKIVMTCQNNADFMYKSLSKIPGLKPVVPSGAMYMMVGVELENFPEFEDDLQFVERMISEQSVFCLPGTCFSYPNYCRVVLTVPEDKLHEACKRIGQFCSQHYSTECSNGINGINSA